MSGRARLARMGLSAVVAALIALAGVVYWLVGANGFSARTQPTIVERIVMRALHRWSIPAAARNAANPVAFSDEVWAESRAHFADHCAACHGNDGRGHTAMGQGLFPKAPDMRLAATQAQTDGEIYWTIENGIRLTGMPAWGTGGGDDLATWKLVHFLRRLDQLTPEQLKGMAAANPRSPSELQEEKDDERFLAGEDTAQPPRHH